jgi:uroporphyrinogen decarboxylase
MDAKNQRFLDACMRKPVDCTPVWLMRQAGRYLPEYRKIRSKFSFIEMCKNPEIAAEVTLQPVRRFEIDAAIIFADILLPLEKMNVGLKFTDDDGPVIKKPVRTLPDVNKLKVIPAEESTPYLFEAIRIVRRELNGEVPLIGFSGAPFTLASYLVEGGHSKDYVETKKIMYHNPTVWQKLMKKLTFTVLNYVNAQIGAGVQAVQIFDSWVGCLSPSDYRKFVFPFMKVLFEKIKRKVPVINFSTGTSGMLELISKAGGDVIGIDWRSSIDSAWMRIGYNKAIQGNLDPAVLLGPQEVIKRAVRDILKKIGNRRGHIFNLGHGVLPATPPDNVKLLVDTVHELSKR